MSPEIYISRRNGFAQAIEACEELIRDYEAHNAPHGPQINAQEIEAVKTAIVRIRCIEARGIEMTDNGVLP